MSFSVNYLVFCVPTLHINNYRNRDIVLNTLIAEFLKPVFIRGECKYNSPSVQEIAEFCRQEKDTLWDETKRLFNPHKVYVDLSQKLYDTKTELLNSVNI